MKLSTKNKIVYSTANIFTLAHDRVNAAINSSNVLIPHVCNNINLFGAGFAAAVAKDYPMVKENFHLLGNKAKLGYVQHLNVYRNKNNHTSLIVSNMIAQNRTIHQNNPRPLNYEYLVKCMIDVRDYAMKLSYNNDTKTEIHCPKFGSGLAGGNWLFIEELIKDIWAELPVFVYSHNAKHNVRV
jgi:hypothetical protein